MTRLAPDSRVAYHAGTTGTLEPPDSVATLVAAMLLALAGVVSQGLAPFIVSSLSTFAKLRADQAGLCVSVEMTGIALGSAAVLFLLTRIPRRPLAAGALLAIMGGNALCLDAVSFINFASGRFLAGLGCGLATAGFGVIATTRAADRNFAIFSGSAVVVFALLGGTVPYLLSVGGLNALFLLIAFPAAVALSCVWLIPNYPRTQGIAAGHSGARPRYRAAVFGLLMTFLFFNTVSAFWTYVAAIGAAGGIAAATVGHIISTAFLVCGTTGSVVAAVAAPRVNRGAVMSICLIGAAISAAVVASRPGPIGYAFAVSAFLGCWFLNYPFVMGILAGIDPSGRLAIFGILVQSAGWISGPAMAGALVERHAYSGFGVLCATGSVLSLLCARASGWRSAPRRAAGGAAVS